MLTLLVITAYLASLLLLSRLTARGGGNDAFFRASRRAPWGLVAVGMVGASISGVSFVSVPGMVLTQGMAYMQMCLGFIVGYFVVAAVLLPLYYRLNLTTIYTYLGSRLGARSYLTGASFFLLSKLTGAVVRFYVVCMLLQRFVLDAFGVPFAVTAATLVALIWLYTRRGGMRTIVVTDTVQTVVMFTALVLIIAAVTSQLGLTLPEAARAVAHEPQSRVFVWGDWRSPLYFWKQFLAGVFIVIVMTGLDQDMMQKNLACRTLRAAQKNVCSYAFAFVPANLLFLSLGVLLTLLAARQGVALPARGDDLLPLFAATGRLGEAVQALFALGIVASAFSSADSALTSLTTSLCVDICRRPSDTVLRRRLHVAVLAVFALSVIAFDCVGTTSIISAIYTLCGYTYGPLLGLFAYGILTRGAAGDRAVPYICVAMPLLCLAIDHAALSLFSYHMGYELLMLNGAMTFTALWLSGRRLA